MAIYLGFYLFLTNLTKKIEKIIYNSSISIYKGKQQRNFLDLFFFEKIGKVGKVGNNLCKNHDIAWFSAY